MFGEVGDFLPHVAVDEAMRVAASIADLQLALRLGCRFRADLQRVPLRYRSERTRPFDPFVEDMFVELGLGALRDSACGIRYCVALGRAKALTAEVAVIAGTLPPQGDLTRMWEDALRCFGFSFVGFGGIAVTGPSLAQFADGVVDAMCRQLQALTAGGGPVGPGA